MRLFEGTKWDRPPRCDRCGQFEEECNCTPETPPRIAPENQTARVAIEKRKKGKIVTTVRGLSVEGNDLDEILARLKAGCGAGGTRKEGILEIQGRQPERVGQVLREIGYKVRGDSQR